MSFDKGRQMGRLFELAFFCGSDTLGHFNTAVVPPSVLK